MNMQALMKQAQNMQKEVEKIKKEIDESEFEFTNAFVTVRVNGKKEVLSIDIDSSDKEIFDDISYVQDVIMIAINGAMKKIDDLTATKMGKFSSLMPGLM